MRPALFACTLALAGFAGVAAGCGGFPPALHDGAGGDARGPGALLPKIGGGAGTNARGPGAAALASLGGSAALDRELDRVEARLEALEAAWTRARDNRAVFATTYRISTRNFRKAILARKFEDGERLGKAVLAFGLLYFDAVDAWEAGDQGRVPDAWRTAFRRAEDRRANAVTHLVLGMNAHIIRDLPFAAASLAPMNESWHRDFLRCNDVLTNEVPEVREEIVRRYGTWGEPGRRDAERWDDELSGRAVVVARAVAWKHAVEIDRDPVGGAERSERYAGDLGRQLDRNALLRILWEWMRRTSGPIA